MSNQSNQSRQTPGSPNDNQNKPVSGQAGVPTPQTPITVVPEAKEHEPHAEEDKIMAEIRSTYEARDAEVLKEVQKVVNEAKLSQPRPVIPPDVEDAGVVHPPAEAEKVIEKGTTLELPIDEATYERGLHQKIAGAVINKTVMGVSSLVALAMWITRLIKMAHKHATGVIFRRQEGG
ncbi:hypothetical protein HYU92_01810 [Candidatus Curtissbacteria bacterium]|nr:hypothetical protein [Candidatus Curtissbacteria bacterium]